MKILKNELGTRICFFCHDPFENEYQETNYHRYEGCCQKHQNFKNRLNRCKNSQNQTERETAYFVQKQIDTHNTSPKEMDGLLKLVIRRKEKISDIISVLAGSI